MQDIFPTEFLISIVWINEFNISKNRCNVTVLCIENDFEVTYSLTFTEILYGKFQQESPLDEFEVIETTLSKLNETDIKSMHSKLREDYWVIKFISGLHLLTISFAKATCVRITHSIK